MQRSESLADGALGAPQPEQDCEGGRLAGTVWPEDRHDLAFRDTKADLVENGNPAEPFRHAIEHRCRHGNVPRIGGPRSSDERTSAL